MIKQTNYIRIAICYHYYYITIFLKRKVKETKKIKLFKNNKIKLKIQWWINNYSPMDKVRSMNNVRLLTN